MSELKSDATCYGDFHSYFIYLAVALILIFVLPVPYTLYRIIGGGTFGKVYYAENRKGNPCAIKILRKDKNLKKGPRVHHAFVSPVEHSWVEYRHY